MTEAVNFEVIWKIKHVDGTLEVRFPSAIKFTKKFAKIHFCPKDSETVELWK